MHPNRIKLKILYLLDPLRKPRLSAFLSPVNFSVVAKIFYIFSSEGKKTITRSLQFTRYPPPPLVLLQLSPTLEFIKSSIYLLHILLRTLTRELGVI